MVGTNEKREAEPPGTRSSLPGVCCSLATKVVSVLVMH